MSRVRLSIMANNPSIAISRFAPSLLCSGHRPFRAAFLSFLSLTTEILQENHPLFFRVFQSAPRLCPRSTHTYSTSVYRTHKHGYTRVCACPRCSCVYIYSMSNSTILYLRCVRPFFSVMKQNFSSVRSSELSTMFQRCARYCYNI